MVCKPLHTLDLYLRPPDLSTTSETPSDSYHKRAISTPSSSPADNAFIDAPQASGFKSESSSDTGTGTTPRKQLSFPGDFVNETLRWDNLLDDTEEPMARKEQDGMRARISEPKSQGSNCENAEADFAGRSELKCSCRRCYTGLYAGNEQRLFIIPPWSRAPKPPGDSGRSTC
ncbi:hypothetical protein M422DRAFT_70431 [Sphaerobolus stellatus SS14]|uniref:Uncharacterized protein n=1 Tax=Sphaerobolus stellatus (strain SS14) TaxID=990650 RepID=A0A0C9V757_SPHS4|nr:hypothetical protein M422DRAFT_70431 [Sphaerobolus stellatus SS14]